MTDEENSAISVKNVIHNYSYQSKVSDDEISRSNVFGINLNNVAINGVSSLSAESIKSNTVYNAYEGDEINHGKIIGLNLSNLKADRKINLSASNIESTLSHDDVSNIYGFPIPTYGIALTGKDSELQIGNITANNITGDISKPTGVYLQDLTEKTTIDNINVSNVTQKSSTKVHSMASVAGVHIEAGSTEESTTDININNELKISNIETNNTASSQRVAGLFIGSDPARDFSNHSHGNTDISAQKIIIDNVKSAGYGTISGLMVNVLNMDKNVKISADTLNVKNISSLYEGSVQITSQYGTYGINLTNSEVNIDDISVDGITSSSGKSDFYAYGIKLNRNSSINSSNIIIKNITGTGNSYGLDVDHHNTKLTTDTLQISEIQGNKAYGLKLGGNSVATESDKGCFTVNDSTYIDVADGYALMSSHTDVNLMGQQAVLSGDVNFDTGLLQINSVTASINGNVTVGNSGKFTASVNDNSRSNQEPLMIKNLRGTNSSNHPQFIENEYLPEYSQWDWKDAKSLDALTVGDV